MPFPVFTESALNRSCKSQFFGIASEQLTALLNHARILPKRDELSSGMLRSINAKEADLGRAAEVQ